MTFDEGIIVVSLGHRYWVQKAAGRNRFKERGISKKIKKED